MQAVGARQVSNCPHKHDPLTGRVYGQGWSALGLAAMLGLLANVRALLAGGADASAQVEQYHYTPLRAALHFRFTVGKNPPPLPQDGLPQLWRGAAALGL